MDAHARQTAAHLPVSDCPIIDGNSVRLLDSGGAAIAEIFAAIGAARDHILLEYYTFADVAAAGTTLGALLAKKLAEGVRVALLYDGIGSDDTPDAFFTHLHQAGAAVLEFRSLNPLKRHFGLRMNDRDHRKLTVIDGRIAFLGGVNLSSVYENPRSAGAPPDAAKAFWYDCAARIEGPAVAEVAKLFHHTWDHHGGAQLPSATGDNANPAATGGNANPAASGDANPPSGTPEPAAQGNATIRVDGSAPREHRQLYYELLHAAVAAAQSRILLATGYFVPTHQEWKLLGAAAKRGVAVDLVLAGYTDVPGAMHAARALYGRLLRRGVRVHELRNGMLHAKVATIDGVWTAIGSSNLDRRSYVYNNEIDAIVFDQPFAGAVEAMLRTWIDAAETITLAGWRQRSVHELTGELLARVWERYM